jgi:uncharacterized protein (DUF2164 family)
MREVKLSTDEKSRLVAKIQHYLQTELDCEAGQFDTEFFLDFLTEELKGHYYNQGLYDAQTILANKIEHINEAISELEHVL